MPNPPSAAPHLHRLLDLLDAGAPAEAFGAVVAQARAEAVDGAGLRQVQEAADTALRIRGALHQHRRREQELAALFDTAGDLAAATDLDTVLKAIVRRARSLLRTDTAYLTLPDEEAGDTYAELPLTTSVLALDEALYVRPGTVAPAAKIEIVQLGGRYPDGCWVEPNDQRILHVDDEVLVYVKATDMVPHDTVPRPDVFAVVGGQQGMVPIQSATLAIFAGSRVTTIEYCCRSDLDGADCAAARMVSSSGSGTSSAR